MVLTAAVVAVSWPLMTACSRGADMEGCLLYDGEPVEPGFPGTLASGGLGDGEARPPIQAARLRTPGWSTDMPHREPGSRPQDTPPAGGRGIAKDRRRRRVGAPRWGW